MNWHAKRLECVQLAGALVSCEAVQKREQAPRTPNASRRGFTLLELVGVLAVMAILAACLVPVAVRRLDISAWSTETASLSAMADALKLYIVRNNAIPDESRWATNIGSQLGLAPNQITTTPRHYSRAYLIDTGGWFGTAQGSLPWNQSATGTTNAPVGARLMIVSTVAGPLPLPFQSGRPPPLDFDKIWNTPLRNMPRPWASWGGKGEDLVIQRINLDPLFCHVILNPIDTTSSGSFAITNGIVSTTTAVAGIPSDSWCLQGSVLSLYNTNNPPVGSPPDTKAIVQADCSYVFENSAWRGQLSGLGTNGPFLNTNAYSAWVAATNFTLLANQFQTATLNTHDTGGASVGDSCVAVLRTFYTFMNDYNFWAQTGFASGWGTNFPSTTYISLCLDSNAVQRITYSMAQ
jgi:prepilin-type N-terminal cleavage/methylation domain-containing protein